jgi:hypothetical protein
MRFPVANLKSSLRLVLAQSNCKKREEEAAWPGASEREERVGGNETGERENRVLVGP